LALGLADRVLMFEHAVYSVITPEGCAAILWKDAGQKERAAASLRLTSEDLLELGLIDEIVAEPMGGAHTDPAGAARSLHAVLSKAVAELVALDVDELIDLRTQKYCNMGRFSEHKLA